MSSSKLSVGFVGLPNVGKSTLFNAISGLQVEAANYPFATIEPNVGVVTVPEPRLDVLARIEKSKKTVPTVIEFKDIAGLVASAHKGEGLGNQFLAHVREVDAIVEVVRFFEDKNITHVSGNVDPKRDIETIETELILADLQLVEKKNENFKKSARSGKHEDIVKAALAQKYFDALSAGRLASSVSITEEEQKFMFEFPFLTNKPILYVANVKSGLDRLIKAAYQTLGLQTFFTAGEQETRAWTITKGDKTPQAAGKIHTDFEKGFIKADAAAYDKFVEAPGWVKAREKGWARSEGKEYVVDR